MRSLILALLVAGLIAGEGITVKTGSLPTSKKDELLKAGASLLQNGKPSEVYKNLLKVPLWDVVDSFPAPGSYHMGLGFDGTYLYNVSNATTPVIVYVIDPSTGNVVNQWQLSSGGYCLGITYFQGYLWIADFSYGYIYKYQTNGTYVQTYSSPVGTYIRGLTNDNNYLWVASVGGGVGLGSLVQWDPSTNQIIRTVSVGSIIDWPMDISYDSRTGNMWVTDDNGASAEINEVDISGSNGVIVAQYAPPGGYSLIPEGIVFDGGTYIYYTAFYASYIWKILAATFNNDVSTYQIISPSSTTMPYTPTDIKAVVKNIGQTNAGSFNVYCVVESLGIQVYSSSQTIPSLPAGASDTITFSPQWTPSEFTYEIIVWHDYADDFAGDDTLTKQVKASSGEWICYNDGVMANAWAFYAAGNAWGHRISPATYPYYVDTVKVYILSEGDPYWPWPDATHQDFQISVFDENSGYPGNEIFVDTVNVTTDSLDPSGSRSWVYAFPKVKINSGDFWIGHVQLYPYPGTEGQGVDASLNYPSRTWARIGGTWQQYATTGDLMMCAFVRYPYAHDVGVFSIEKPKPFAPAYSSIQIQAKIVNEGLNTESFNVEAKIDSAGVTVYADTVLVNNLISDDTLLVSFAPFTTGAGNLNYTLTIKTLLSTDVKPTNNFKSLSFTTVEVPRFITVPVSQVMPIIDGFIDTLSEWNDAIKLDASDVFQMHGLLNPPGSAFIYLKYDGDYLYAAVRAPFDLTRTQFDRIFLYFDDNNDGQFPPPGIKKEGRVALYYTSILDIAAFTPIFVDRTLGQTKSVGFPCASAMPLGYEQYEIAIPFGSLDEELDVSFPDTVGFFFQVGDTFANKIEYGGWFPQDNDSVRVPSYYTKLIFPVVAVKEGKKPINIKERLELALNIPNSISKNPEINFTIPYASPVKINLYNVNGVKVATLIDNKFMTPGKYSVKIDRDKLSSGVYFVRLETNTKDITKKLVFVK